MPCQEWFALATRYRNAVRIHSERIDAWSSLSPGSEFQIAWQLAEKARKASGDARAALLHHEHDHQCLMDCHMIPQQHARSVSRLTK